MYQTYVRYELRGAAGIGLEPTLYVAQSDGCTTVSIATHKIQKTPESIASHEYAIQDRLRAAKAHALDLALITTAGESAKRFRDNGRRIGIFVAFAGINQSCKPRRAVNAWVRTQLGHSAFRKHRCFVHCHRRTLCLPYFLMPTQTQLKLLLPRLAMLGSL